MSDSFFSVSMKRKLVLLGIVTLSVVLLDQWTKDWIVRNYLESQSTVVTSFFNITYVKNFGAAFGIFRTLQENIREAFFLLMPPIAMVVIVFMLQATEPFEKVRTWALCLVFGGALGNYVDRIHYGFVVDFLDFHIMNKYKWPAFNVADISIVCGITLLIGLELGVLKDQLKKRT